MSVGVIKAICKRLVEQSARQHAGFAIVLHGGEPLLLGYERLKMLTEGLRAHLGHDRYPISVQTNGALLDDRLLDLFAATRTSVSVSIDGPTGVNDLARLDHKGDSTFAATMRGIRALALHSAHEFLFAGTLSVIQPTSNPATVYHFLKKLGTPSMDFLLQDGNHDRLPVGKQNFDSTEYGSWLTELFEIYVTDPEPVPIRVLDDFVKLCLGGVSQEEGRGSGQFGILIFESDGEIRKNDTLRSSFDGADHFAERWNIKTTPLADVLGSDEFKNYSQIQLPTAQACLECRVHDICGGGMPLYRWSTEQGMNNPSVYCRDHITLIDSIRGMLFDHGLLPPAKSARVHVS